VLSELYIYKLLQYHDIVHAELSVTILKYGQINTRPIKTLENEEEEEEENNNQMCS